MEFIRNKKIIIVLVGVFIALTLVGVWAVRNKSNQPEEPVRTSRERDESRINLIPVEDRPYITLQPLTARNQLELTIHDLKLPADEVEVILEYDRNKGILDAVLRQFSLPTLPHRENLFLGSRSAGGHITFHDDVIGGTIRLNFEGDNDYILEVPWRYDDTQSQYTQLSTTDGLFQLELETPIRSSKVVIMQSPGLPAEIEGDLVSGPYLVRTVGTLPTTSATISIRLPQGTGEVSLLGWNGEEWEEIDSQVEGRSLTAEHPLMQTYAVTSN